jgi:hypothetical protein
MWHAGTASKGREKNPKLLYKRAHEKVLNVSLDSVTLWYGAYIPGAR